MVGYNILNVSLWAALRILPHVKAPVRHTVVKAVFFLKMFIFISCNHSKFNQNLEELYITRKYFNIMIKL